MPRVTREAWASLRVDGAKVPRDLRKAEGQFRQGGKRAGKQFTSGFKKSLKRLRRVGGLVAGLGVGAALKGGFDEAVKFEDQMQRLGSQARRNAGEMAEMRAGIESVSAASGIARGSLADALDEMVNLQGGEALSPKNLDTLSVGMLGTGTAGRDLAQVMFALSENMKISQEEMRGVVGGIDKIGTVASIPFSQLATSYVEVAAAAAKMGVKGPEGVFATVAAMQAMRKEIPTADEIKTSFTGLVTELIKKRRQIKKKFKVDVAIGKGKNEKLRDLVTVLSELQAGGLGTTTAITDVFGKRAAKGVTALLNNFKQFQKLRKEGAAGAQQDFLGIRAAERANSAAGRMDRSITGLKRAFAEPFTTENINAAASAVAKIAGFINKSIAGWRELTSLFDSGSSNRKLIADTSNADIAEAGFMSAFETFGGVPAQLLGRGSDIFPSGDIQAFQRPGHTIGDARRRNTEADAEAARVQTLTNSPLSNVSLEREIERGMRKAMRSEFVTIKGGPPGASGARSNP